MTGRRFIGALIGLVCMVLGAYSQTVVSEVVGFTKVDIPPGGGFNLVGFNFTSDQPLYLEDIFGTNQLTRAALFASAADTVHIWDGSSYTSYYQKTDGFFYSKTTGLATQVEVSSGSAMFLQSPLGAQSTNTISFFGTVLETPSEILTYADLVTIANPYPTDLNLNSVDFDWSGATASLFSSAADKIHIWNTTSGGYESFFLNNSRVWTPLSTGVPIIPTGAGAFYQGKGGSFSNSVVKPF